MDFLNLDIKRSYISCGTDSIASAFLVPALKCTKKYKRSVGFFSSGVFEPIMDGIVNLSRNGGTIQLIASPKLSEDDIQAINAGYEAREKIVSDAFTRDFIASIVDFEDEKLILLTTLIARGTLDIKIAVTETIGDYHDKLGILEDNSGHTIVFYGSANSSINGYKNNYEKIRVVRSWVDGEKDSVADEISEFDSLWNGTNKYVTVYNYSESAKSNIFQVIEQHSKAKSKKSDSPITLRDYQEQAIKAWVDNNYHGFYVMATGTGKTWTAIYSAKELMKKQEVLKVICAPYKHLVKQWSEDVAAAFPNAKIILVSSENPGWDNQITQAIIGKKYNPGTQIIVISTIKSFKTDRFAKAIAKSKDRKLLIVDEAHRFTDRSESIASTYQYMLGLSATPFSGSSAVQGHELMSFFGGQVFSLPIEEALERGYLVPYYYHPIYVSATDDEESLFQYHTHKILSCFKNNKCINPDLLVKSLRNRLRVISMAEEKQSHIDEILRKIDEPDHFVVYCGDGRLFDKNTGDEIRHIQSVKRALTEHGYKSSQFTATENMVERMQLVDAFNKGQISALAAIRCLDEGINIPSIKSALILSSNDDYREFVQRRGRILRKYNDKEAAHIYDVIVLPSDGLLPWAKIELRRFNEYAKLALNWNDLSSELEEHLYRYGLSYDDIDVYDYENMEVELDE